MKSRFEFDDSKSASNQDKQGIDFVEAQRLWKDENLLIVQAKSVAEMRWVAVGVIDEKCWTAVFTLRDAAVRIISVRRARDYEIEGHFGPRV